MTASTKKHTTLLSCIDEMCKGGPILAGARPYHRLRKDQWGEFDKLFPQDVYLFWFDHTVSSFIERYGDLIGLRYASPEMYRFVKNNGKALQYQHSKQQSRVFIVSTKIHLLDSLFLLRAELEVMIDYHESLASMDFLYGANFLRSVLKWPSNKFIKFAKYHTAAPMAYCLGNPLPENPSSEFFSKPFDFLVWKGPIRKFLRQRLKSNTLSSVLPLWWGYLQGLKRGCAVVSKDFILQSMVDHAKILSTDAPALDDVMAESRFEECISLFYARVPHSPDLRLTEPSRKASTQNPMSMGGTRELIYDRLSSEANALGSRSLNRETVYDPQMKRDISVSFPILHQEELTNMVQTSVSEVKEERGSVFKLYNAGRLADMIQQEGGHFSFAKVSSVLEPLKVRLITKMDGLKSTYVQPIQRAMWEYNATWPQFALTKQPLEEVLLLNMIDREKQHNVVIQGVEFRLDQYFDRQGGWVSGDYSAATDNLNLRFTKLLFESFLDSLLVPDKYKEYARDILYEQTIHYPQPYSSEMYDLFEGSTNPNIVRMEAAYPGDKNSLAIRQVNGQLMGSILSFPILCVANLICYWVAFDKWRMENYLRSERKSWDRHVDVSDLRSLPVLINGDDILFRADRRLYEIWQQTISLVGFKLSIGKNYFHQSVLTVNSELWVYKPGSLKKIGYFNIGLLQGKTKVSTEDKGISDTSGYFDKPLNDQYKLVVKGAVNGLRAHNRFIHYRRQEVERATRYGRYNLFLPTVLYGLGFCPDFVNSSVLRVFHHRLASYKYHMLLRNQESGLSRYPADYLKLLEEKVSYVRGDLAPSSFPFRTHHHYFASVSLKNDVTRYPFHLDRLEGVMPPLYQQTGPLHYEVEWKVKYPSNALKKKAWTEKNPSYVSWDKLQDSDKFQIRFYSRKSSDYEVFPPFRIKGLGASSISKKVFQEYIIGENDQNRQGR